MTSITPQVLLQAYAAGIFPMAESAHDPALYWVEPDERGVIPLIGFHVSRSLAKRVKQHSFEVRIDTSFNQVIAACAAKSETRKDTWINKRIITLYSQLHKMGCAHSVEAWQNGELVGGLYGVALGACFCGESMFHRAPDASKICVVTLVERLQKNGFQLMDCQQQTPHMGRFGAHEIPDADYAKLLDGCRREAVF